MKTFASLLAPTPSRAAPGHTRQAAFADNDGVKIAFEVQGRGAPILLLPGFSQSREAWKQAGFVEPLLAAGRQVSRGAR